MKDKNKDYSQIEEKVQSKLDELVTEYERQRKSASKGSQFYNDCISIVREIEHLKSFAKEFLDVEIDFWRQPKSQYDPGPIVDCKVISKEEREIEEWDR